MNWRLIFLLKINDVSLLFLSKGFYNFSVHFKYNLKHLSVYNITSSICMSSLPIAILVAAVLNSSTLVVVVYVTK